MKPLKKVKNNGSRQYYLFGIKVFEQQKKPKLKGDLSDNKVTLPDTGKFNIQIFGKNNEVYVNPENKKSSLSLIIYGDNNKVTIHSTEETHLHGVIGDINTKTKNTVLSVDKKTSIGNMFFILMDDNSQIKVGKNCMLSTNIEVLASDTHSILDENGNLINQGKEIVVGNNVWIGKDVKVLKNTVIPDGCIVGMGSIVSKKFTNQKSILAGIPAKVVKENISWSKKRPNEFLTIKDK